MNKERKMYIIGRPPGFLSLYYHSKTSKRIKRQTNKKSETNMKWRRKNAQETNELKDWRQKDWAQMHCIV